MKPTPIHDPLTWNRLVAGLGGGHLLQSWEWGQLKSKYGWQAERLVWHDHDRNPRAAAQVLRRAISFPGLGDRLAVLYCPRGPILDWSQQGLRQLVLTDLATLAVERGVISIKIDPDLPLGYSIPGEKESKEDPLGKAAVEDLLATGWRESAEQIQFRNTLTLDLTLSEDDLLAGMKQKTRYNIRLASRRGVRVRRGGQDDFDLLYRMYAETSVRDGFAIRKPEYYQDAWSAFINAGLAQPFMALVEDEPVAALIVYRFGEVATYMYGMSRPSHREKMPNHLLQWEAILWAKEHGCTTYDFWGAPDQLDANDPMWGVYRFKTGFGARFVRTLGAWDFPVHPIPYGLYTIVKPRLMSILRFKGRAQTRRHLD